MSKVHSNLQDMVTKYGSNLEETLNRTMSKTVQFRMKYVKIVGPVQLMHHAVKINYMTQYSFALFEVSSIIFMTKHPNYAHWISLLT